MTLTLSNPLAGSLSTTTAGSTSSSYNVSTGVWTASGPVGEVNTLLATLVFTPTADFNGSTTLSSSISDGINTAVTDSKTITINAVNDAPVLDNSGSMTLSPITEDESSNNGNSVAEIISSAGGDRITDIDSSSEGIAIISHSDQRGHWEFSLDGGSSWQSIASVSGNNALLLRETDRLRFVPDGTDGLTASINFHAWDQSSGVAGSYSDISASNSVSSNAGNASINVSAINDAPTVLGLNTPENYTEDQGLPLSAIHISDVDDSVVTVTLRLSDPQAGQISTDSTGSATASFDASTGTWQASGNITDINLLLADLEFTPNQDVDHDFSLAVSVDDGSDVVTGSKFFSATPVNDAPVASDEQLTLDEGANIQIDVLANDNDIDDGINRNSIEIVSGVTHGTLTINVDGSISYQHDDSENFADSFSYRIRDNAGNWSNIANVSLSINALNDNIPTAEGHRFTILAGDELHSEFSLLDYASDTDNDSLTVVLIAGPGNGELQINADGSFSYTPNTSFSGADRFTYVISDGQHVSELATVSIRVQASQSTQDNEPKKKPDSKTSEDLVDNDNAREEENAVKPRTPVASNFNMDREAAQEDQEAGDLRFLKNNPQITPLPELDLWSAETKDDRRLSGAINLGQLRNDMDLDQLESLFADGELWKTLDDRRAEEEEQSLQEEYLSQAVAASGLSVSAGIVSWILRGGSLAAGMLSTLPGWRGVDPLPILSRHGLNRTNEDVPACKAETLFDQKDK